MINLLGLPISKLEELMLSEGQKKYRAIQLYTWIYEKKATSFDEMSDISIKFREVLKEKYCLDIPTIDKIQRSKDGTIKLLVKFSDGLKVETVLMRYSYGNAACVSSQVGCNMGCSFCATTFDAIALTIMLSIISSNLSFSASIVSSPARQA